jgi:hypothetical protein
VEANDVTVSASNMNMRWDLLEGGPPAGESLAARLAVPARCGDVFIGVDAALLRYVLVRIPPGEPGSLSERASRGIAVRTLEMKIDGSSETEIFVEIACLEPDGHAALDIVTIELVEALVAGATIGRVRLVQTVLSKWRRFWSGFDQKLLSRERHVGLFGELWFLARWLLPAMPSDRAIGMWRGPVGSRHDFERRGLAVEVKTSSRLDGSHEIHGLEQLLQPDNGDLFLFSILVREEASSLESLPVLVKEIRAQVSSDHLAGTQFDGMLSAAGYDEAFEAEYEKLKLRVRAQGLYRVDAGFPRLVPASMAGGLPPGVTGVSYDLRLDAAGAWLLSETPRAVADLLKQLSEKA